MAGRNLLINSFKGLSPKQRTFMWVFCDKDMNITETCRQMRMNPDTFYRWMNKPVFKAYHDFILALHTDGFEVMVWKKLMDKIEKKGDVAAIRTYFEIKNKLKTHQTKIDNRNTRFTVKFGRPDSDSQRTDNRLHSASQATGDNGGQDQV